MSGKMEFKLLREDPYKSGSRIALGLIFFLFAVSSCGSPTQVETRDEAISTPSETSEPDFTSTVTPTVTATPDALLIVLSQHLEPVAEGVVFNFGEGISQELQNVVVASTNIAYQAIAEYVGFASIPASVNVVSNCEDLREAYADYLAQGGVEGTNGANYDPCGDSNFAQPGAFFILVIEDSQLARNIDELAGFVFHEYFHVFQIHLVEEVDGSIDYLPWIWEGSADYIKLLLLEDLIEGASLESWTRRENYLQTNTKTIEEIGANYDATEAYTLGSLAIRYLVDQYGLDRLIDYFRIQGQVGMRAAFQETFGMSVSHFSVQFEAYREEFFPYVTATPTLVSNDNGRIEGHILMEDGTPMGGVLVWAAGENDYSYLTTLTNDDGFYSVEVPAGPWLLGLMIDGQTWSGFFKIGQPGNYTNVQLQASPFIVDKGETTNINVSFPMDELTNRDFWQERYPCGVARPVDDGNIYSIGGTLFNSDGSVNPSLYVNACSADNPCVGGHTNNGMFSIRVGNGIYYLLVNSNVDDSVVGIHTNAGLLDFDGPVEMCEAAIVVNGENVEQIEITLP